jgi:penicillin-insensitive murein endopeptidase
MIVQQKFILPVALACAACLASPALAQMKKGTLDPVPLPPIANPDDPDLPAKQLFGRRATAAELRPQAIGYYIKGCLAGGEALPLTGPAWQVMRVSRNRNWAHPTMIQVVERIATRVAKISDWAGLLVGDMSQPRGGPMLTGHLSHQVGLDADIWLRPMPKRELTPREREYMSATNLVAADKRDVNPDIWTPGHYAALKTAAQQPEVERVLVNAAIKKALCREAGNDRGWLRKVRPWWGHNYHFHVRISCPKGSANCRSQPPPSQGDACGKPLDWWFRDAILHPPPPKKPPKKRKPLTMADLPSACRQVLLAQ